MRLITEVVKTAFIAIAALLLMSCAANAQTPNVAPPALDPSATEQGPSNETLLGHQTTLFDEAGLFSAAQSTSLNASLNQILDDHGCPILVATLPNRVQGMNMHEVAAQLFHRLHSDTMQVDPMSKGELDAKLDPWRVSVMIVLNADRKICGVYAAPGWDRRDAERILRVNNGTTLPLLRTNGPFRALDETLGELKNIAKTRRTPINSYWSFYVDTQKLHWRELGDQLKTTVTAPPIQNAFFPVFLVIGCIFLWEWILPWRKDQARFRDGIGLDLIYTVFSYVFFWGLFGTALCTVTAAAFDNILYDVFGVENLIAIELSAMPQWTRLILLLLSMEFVSYWIHRLLHQFQWAWEFHKIHHSAPQIDVFNAARLHFGERLIYQFFSYVPLSMVGFGVTNMIYVGLFTTVFSNLTHANVRLPIGPLKYIINTPQLHIWHHENEYHKRGNVNFGDTLIVWDIVFRTFYLPTEPVDTSQLSLGFDGVEEYPQTFIAQTILPFKAIARSISAKLNGRDNSPS